MVQHLYVHIPFCPRVCPYCSFYKEASDRNKTQGFLDAVLKEAQPFREKLRPTTIFFGGGTPSALSVSQLEFLLNGLHQTIDFSALTEWTLEMNPATVSLEKAQLLLSSGVNRISMGVQAWDEASLNVLGRIHSAKQAFDSYEILRKAGFTNINLDLIFGVPGQSLEQWEKNLETTTGLQPEHISAYCLTYEEDTAFFERWRKGEFGPDEDRDAGLFERTMDLLEAGGYGQYEISNYSRPGKECLHNLAYWRGNDFIGLGPSAVSTHDGRRWVNVPDTSAYIDQIARSGSAAGDFEDIDEGIRRRELLAFGLRTRDGVATHLFPEITDKISPLVQNGYLVAEADTVRLTRRGLLLADGIATELWGF